MDKQVKKKIITQNMTLCEFGLLKNLPLIKPIKHCINNNLQIPDTNNFCEVYVVKDIQPLSIAREYIFKKIRIKDYYYYYYF